MSRAAPKRRISYVIRLSSYGITVYRGKSKSVAEWQLQKLKRTDKVFERCKVEIEVAKAHTSYVNVNKQSPHLINNRWTLSSQEQDDDADDDLDEDE